MKCQAISTERQIGIKTLTTKFVPLNNLAGTVRRFLERFSQHMERIVFVVNSIDVSIYEILLPLYFPRTMQDEDCGCYLLPVSA